MTPNEQLEKWVNGESIHNQDRDECCPDFSCCEPALAATPDERRIYRDRPELRDQMLMGWLGAALHQSGLSKEVRIIGEDGDLQ